MTRYCAFDDVLTLAQRIDIINGKKFKMVQLLVTEDPLKRAKLKHNRQLWLIQAAVPQSYGTQQKVKDPTDGTDLRDKDGDYVVHIIVEIDIESGKITGAGEGESAASDGILWYKCRCKNGARLCTHIKAILVALSRIRVAEMSNHSFATYWSPVSHKTPFGKAVKVVELMTTRVYLSDIMGRKVTDADIESLL